jgi:hypothetical protein
LQIINKNIKTNKNKKGDFIMLLTEKHELALSAANMPAIKESDKAVMALILESQEKAMQALISEETLSGDIGAYTPILMPLVRRAYSSLIANEIAGVQPMTGPTGHIYAMVYKYIGNGTTKVAPSSAAGMVILNLASVTGATVDGAISGTLDDSIADPVETATGTIAHIDGTKVLVKVLSGTFTSSTVVNFAATVTQSTGIVVSATYSNVAGFGQILKGYTGSYTTANGEVLGAAMNQIGFTVDRKTITAVSRKLKGEYTLEMLQDLKAQHGEDAEAEIMNLMAMELQANIDREVIAAVNTNATQEADLDLNRASGIGQYAFRNELEGFRAIATRIEDAAREIGRLTRRGGGNIVIVSPKVATALSTLNTFNDSRVDNTIDTSIVGAAVVGTLNGKYKVIVDNFAEGEYVTVLYKGADRRDAGVFFSPYVGASFQKITHEQSGQPGVILTQRYSVDTNPLNPESYMRTFGVIFTNTTLA